MKSFRPTLLALTGLLVLSLPATAQQAQRVQAPQNNQPTHSIEELETFYFTPTHVSARELEDIARDMYGRNIFLKEPGGSASRPVQNLLRIGDTLIIHDTPDNAQRLGVALHELDAALEGQSQPSREPLMVSEWSPRFVSLDSGLTALQSFARAVWIGTGDHDSTRVANISVVRERNQLVLRDAPEAVASMLDVLNRVDVASPQLDVTCLIIRGSRHAPEPDATPVPQELAENLARLVPYAHFELVTLGLVRTSTRPGQLKFEMDGEYELNLQVEAYDPQTNSLSTECRFEGQRSQGFRTQTTVKADEYTVLGAAGSEPLFAVLKIQPIDG